MLTQAKSEAGAHKRHKPKKGATVILIALGANLNGPHGSAIETLQKCTDFFALKNIKLIKSSNIWISAPVPVSDQPWYHNAVCEVETDKSPHDLLALLRDIETENGRTRHIRNEARTLDLDLIAYREKIIKTDTLLLPHPRLHERSFVLMPLREIVPHWVHPLLDQSVDEMIKQMPTGQNIKCLNNTALRCDLINKRTT